MKPRSIVVTALLCWIGSAACEKQDQAAVHRRKGNEMWEQGNWAEAGKEWGLSLQIDPKQEKLWQKKAAAYMKAGNTDEAAAALLATIDQIADAGTKVERYRSVAGLYLETRHIEQAEKYFTEALKLDPKDDVSLAWLGEIYSTRGGARAAKAQAVPAELEKAIGYYDQAIAVTPAAVLPYVNKRIALLKIQKHELEQVDAAEREALVRRKDKTIVADAKGRAAQHKARADELKGQIDQLAGKISELQQAAKEKKK